jgi:Fe-S-cluster containining protein
MPTASADCFDTTSDRPDFFAMLDTLIQIVDTAVADAYRRGGAHLVCKPGCSQCCIGVFPIAHEDVARLREGLALLEQTDPTTAARIHERVAQSLTRLDPWFPGDRTTGILDEEYETSQLFTEELGDNEPCPVLDPVTGTCDLYEHRPILCRTFGPPMRTAENNLATCELCFIHASTEEIAACELDPTIPAHEAASNEAFNRAHNLHGQTLIAYALRNP